MTFYCEWIEILQNFDQVVSTIPVTSVVSDVASSPTFCFPVNVKRLLVNEILFLVSSIDKSEISFRNHLPKAARKQYILISVPLSTTSLLSNQLIFTKNFIMGARIY